MGGNFCVIYPHSFISILSVCPRIRNSVQVPDMLGPTCVKIHTGYICRYIQVIVGINQADANIYP